jgi:hydroxyacylglutathione hydrolase
MAVKAATGCDIIGPEEVRRTAPLDRVVVAGDEVRLGETRFQVFETGGHTLGHISYYDAADEAVFVGDTLFVLGCGRLFEGTPEQMWASLERLAELPDATRVFCAHEYTAANARFAVTVDDSPAVRQRVEAVLAARSRGEPTVPTTIGLEKATNPFLRASLLEARQGRSASSPVAAFASLRAQKDAFKG